MLLSFWSLVLSVISVLVLIKHCLTPWSFSLCSQVFLQFCICFRAMRVPFQVSTLQSFVAGSEG